MIMPCWTKCNSNFLVPVLLAPLLGSCALGGSICLAQSDKALRTLGSDLIFCGSTSTSVNSCKERLTTDIENYEDNGHKPLNRHIEELAGALGYSLAGRRVSTIAASRLASAIIDILQSADLAATKLADKVQDAKAALLQSDVSERNRNSVIASLRIVS